MVNKFQELQCHFLPNAIIAGFMVQFLFFFFFLFFFKGCGTLGFVADTHRSAHDMAKST